MEKSTDKVDKPNGTDTAEIQLTEMAEDKSNSNEKQKGHNWFARASKSGKASERPQLFDDAKRHKRLPIQELEGYKENPTVMNLCEDLFVTFALQRPSTKIVLEEGPLAHRSLKNRVARRSIGCRTAADLNNRWIKVIVLTTENRLSIFRLGT